ncbi:MAG: response regulator, partial [Lentisphaeraceae bacterium]|nr:response regulator [Lentisphaeraceae bacterium]
MTTEKTIRTKFSLICGGMVALLLTLVVLTIMMLEKQEKLDESQTLRFSLSLKADELRQSSDDLTRLARSYAVSGDAKYEKFYLDILKIRNGEKTRPFAYEKIYYDFLCAGLEPDSKGKLGSRESLLKSLKSLGCTAEELEKLEEAKNNSDGLVRTETIAMNAVKGLFEDKNGDFSVKKTPDKSLATRLMFDEKYHLDKANIMRPINEFFFMLDERTAQAVIKHKAEMYRYVYSMIAVIVFLMLISVYFYSTVIKLSANLSLSRQEVNEKEKGLELYKLQLEVSADFSLALNQSTADLTYQNALEVIRRHSEAPLVAIYSRSNHGFLYCEKVLSIDGKALDAKELSTDGLVLKCLQENLELEAKGPFENLSFDLGVASMGLDSIKTYPISFQNHVVGVLLVAQNRKSTPELEDFIRNSLKQLAIRINSFQEEQQKTVLVNTLRDKSKALEVSQEKALRASRSKSEFLANMSHELRTPMNSIIGFTHRLLKKLSSDLGARELDALETVERNAKNLLNLINDILDLSKIEAGKMDLALAEENLITLTKDVLTYTESLTDHRNVHVERKFPEEAILIKVDAIKYRQIITNLISNAVKFTDEGLVTVTLSQGKDPDLGECAIFSVKDTGVGIREEDRQRLFQKFMQLDGSTKRKVGGTGLGLAITSNFVELHGGRIDVESTYGEGSEFIVYLPMNRRKKKVKSTEAVSFEKNLGDSKPVILCVDDDPDTLKYYQQTFEDEGYAVITAEEGETAMQILKGHQADLICLDLNMPGLNG